MSELTDEINTSENIRLRLAKARSHQAEMESEIETERKENREGRARHLTVNLEYVQASGKKRLNAPKN